MQFNPDITKQAIQVIFSQKRDNLFTCLFSLMSLRLSSGTKTSWHDTRLELELSKSRETEDCKCKKGNWCHPI